MVTLRVIFGLGVGLLVTKIKTGAGLLRTFFYLPVPRAAGGRRPWRSSSCSTRAPGRSTRSSASSGLPEPGLVQRPGLVEAGAHPAGAVGHRRPDGDLHGRRCSTYRRSSTRRPSSTAPAPGSGSATSRCPTSRRSSCFAVVTGVIQTMQYYTQPFVAGQGRQRASSRAPGSSSSPATRTKSTLTLPQLVYNLGFQRFDIGSACVIALVLFALSMAFTALLMRRAGLLGTDAGASTRLVSSAATPRRRPPATVAHDRARVDGGARARRSPRALFFVLPFVFVALTALMTDEQTLTRDLWPHTWQWHNLVDGLAHPRLRDLVAQHPDLRRARHRADPGLEHPGRLRAGARSGSAAAAWR